MKHFVFALAASTTLATPAFAQVHNLVGPVMANPTVEDIQERCDYYAGLIDLKRDAILGDAAEPDVTTTLQRYDDITSLLFTGLLEGNLYSQVMGTADLRAAGGGRCLCGANHRIAK